jgi:hypothetical protein
VHPPVIGADPRLDLADLNTDVGRQSVTARSRQ